MPKTRHRYARLASTYTFECGSVTAIQNSCVYYSARFRALDDRVMMSGLDSHPDHDRLGGEVPAEGPGRRRRESDCRCRTPEVGRILATQPAREKGRGPPRSSRDRQ